MPTKCDLCETNEADFTASRHDPSNDSNPWQHIFLCGTCLTAALFALLMKLGLIVVDVHTLLKVIP